MTKKQPFQCRLLECHATEQFGKSLSLPWPKLRAVGSPSYEASQLKKIIFQTKINLSSARGGRLILRPRWTPRVYSLLYTTASLPMMLGPKAQALSCRISCRQNIYFCLIRRLNRQKYHIVWK